MPVCSYCTNSHVMLCLDCHQYFCHSFLGTVSSHIVFHLRKTKHNIVGLQQPFKCIQCNQTDVFQLGLMPTNDTNNNNDNATDPVILCKHCNPNVTALIQDRTFCSYFRQSEEEESYSSSETYENTVYHKNDKIIEEENIDEEENIEQKNITIEKKQEDFSDQNHFNFRTIQFESPCDYAQSFLKMLKKEHLVDKLIRKQLSLLNCIIEIKNNKIYFNNKGSVGDEIRVEILAQIESDQRTFSESDKRTFTETNRTFENKSGNTTSPQHDQPNDNVQAVIKAFIVNDTFTHTIAEISSVRRLTGILSTSNDSHFYQCNIIFPFRNISYSRIKRAINTFIKKDGSIIRDILTDYGNISINNEEHVISRTSQVTPNNNSHLNRSFNDSPVLVKERPYELVIKDLLKNDTLSLEDSLKQAVSLSNKSVNKAVSNKSLNNITNGSKEAIQPASLPQLNNPQLLAIKHSLLYPITLIQGPPGTGKTVTSVAVIYNHYYHYHSSSLSSSSPFDQEKGSVCSNEKSEKSSNEKSSNEKESEEFKESPTTRYTAHVRRRRNSEYMLESIDFNCTDSILLFTTNYKLLTKLRYKESKMIVTAPSNIAIDNISSKMADTFSSTNTNNLSSSNNSTLVIPSYFLRARSPILRIVSRNREGLSTNLDHITLHCMTNSIIQDIAQTGGNIASVNNTASGNYSEKKKKRKSNNKISDKIVEWLTLCEIFTFLYQGESKEESKNESKEEHSGEKNSSTVLRNHLVDRLDYLFRTHVACHIPAVQQNSENNIDNKNIDNKNSDSVLINTIRFYLIQSHSIIICTLVTSGTPLLFKFSFPFVLIDESVQSTEPMSIIPLCYGIDKLILVGDHKQLGPTVVSDSKKYQQCTCGKEHSLKDHTLKGEHSMKGDHSLKGGHSRESKEEHSREHSREKHTKHTKESKTKHTKKEEEQSALCETCLVRTTPLRKSLFERLLKKHIPILLTVQYRMDPLLCEFINRMFYGGRLRTSISLNVNTTLSLPKTFFFNSSFPEEQSGVSYVNKKEAVVVLKLLNYLRLKGIKNEEIGIITPYEGQRNYINQLINTHGNTRMQYDQHTGCNVINDNGIEIANVDAFQGREKSFIIISLVRSNAECEIGFLRNRRRMNVALSRSKQGCYLIGDVRTYYYGGLSNKTSGSYSENNVNNKNVNVNVRHTAWHHLITWYIKRGLLVEGEIENLKSVGGKEISFERKLNMIKYD